ncbi:MAG: Ig-like domain repeat protein [Rhizobiaceae bacterium]|nr:Ig-like domain repeat protein [Rhizobiaceae bacterium]
MLRNLGLFLARLAFSIALSAAATFLIPALAFASDGCDAVNNGAFDKTDYEPGGPRVLNTQSDFAIGDTIVLMVSGNSPSGETIFMLLNDAFGGPLASSNFGDTPERLEYTVTGTGDLTMHTHVTPMPTGPTSITIEASCESALATPTITVSSSNPNPAQGASVTFTATLSDGSSPSGTVTFKDGATTLGTGTISGTTATYSTSALTVGAHTITAEYAGDDSNDAATSAPITVTVAVAPTTFVFNPASGNLADAMAGGDYSQPISATGGSGTLVYSLISGTLPDGVVLNVSTGALTGPVEADAEVRDYTFTIQVTDGNDATGTANYTIKVKSRTVSMPDRTIEVAAGTTPRNVDLTSGATGGPFASADVVSVVPANAGTATIVNGEFASAGPITSLGWYLKFIPNPAYSGHATVQYRLTSSLGVSSTGTITYLLTYDPAQVATEIDGLVHGFVKTRQNLISSTIKVPGLMERRRMSTSRGPVTASLTPLAGGMTTTFSTSLAQIEAAAANADNEAGTEPSRFNIWIDGALMFHNRDENGSRWGTFGLVSTGADYMLSDKALIGLSFHYDRMSDPTDEDAELTGNGWLAGPYASLEIHKGVFWDTSLLYGGSSNDIDTAFWDGSFDTSRWLLDTAISGQWQLDEVTTVTPRLRAAYFSETIKDYAVQNGSGDLLEIKGFSEEQLRVSLGAEIARQFTLENDSVLTPKIGLTAGFSELDGSGAFGRLSAGLSLNTANNWNVDFGLLLNVEDHSQVSTGAKLGIGVRF